MHRGQALESLLDAFGVIPLDVVFDSLGEFLDGSKNSRLGSFWCGVVHIDVSACGVGYQSAGFV
ncbi:hypothetical protein FRC0043_01399 [Corynebacterium belfantii]|nr:hypothetical protein FRC0043_01399 [Corynebacterium belfantii]